MARSTRSVPTKKFVRHVSDRQVHCIQLIDRGDGMTAAITEVSKPVRLKGAFCQRA
jgi:hypothetical protein